MCVRQAAGKKVSVLLPEYALRVNTMQQNLDAQLALIRQREQEIQTLQTDYRVTYAGPTRTSLRPPGLKENTLTQTCTWLVSLGENICMQDISSPGMFV